jgi:hypothetical protein
MTTEAEQAEDAEPRETERLVEARYAGGVSMVLHLLVMAAFALPFLSMSCGEARTRPMTGFELIMAAEPEWIESTAPTEPEELEVVRVGLQAATARARVAFVATALALTCAVWAFASKGQLVAVWFLLGLGIGAAFSFTLLLTDDQLFSSSPGVQHYRGLFAASGLAVAAAFCDVVACKLWLRCRGAEDPLSPLVLGIATPVLVIVGFVLVIAVGWPEPQSTF